MSSKFDDDSTPPRCVLRGRSARTSPDTRRPRLRPPRRSPWASSPPPAAPDAALTPYAKSLIAFKAKQLCRKPGFGRCDEDDLVQDLTLCLLEKGDRYDPSRGASIDTFAIRRARQRDEPAIEPWRSVTWPRLLREAKIERRTPVFLGEAGFHLLPSVVKTYAPMAPRRSCGRS